MEGSEDGEIQSLPGGIRRQAIYVPDVMTLSLSA
jgi:hypothetical protein